MKGAVRWRKRRDTQAAESDAGSELPDETRPPIVEADEKTIAYIQQRGGCIYVCLDSAGLMRVRRTQPGEEFEFDRLDCGTYTLFVDTRIAPPKRWRLVCHRFPFGY